MLQTVVSDVQAARKDIEKVLVKLKSSVSASDEPDVRLADLDKALKAARAEVPHLQEIAVRAGTKKVNPKKILP